MFLFANFLILSCIPCRLSGQLQLEEGLLTVAMVGSWFFMIFFAGAIKLTGPFVTMVYSMITGDMLTFGIIYLIFILAFSQAFFYLYKSHPKVNDFLFEDFHNTWMALYQMTLGQYSYDDLNLIAYPNMAKTVFILFMILVPILLLNMLIAMMGNTYSQVIERSEKEWVKQWAKIVVALERAISQEDAKNYIQEYSIKLGGSDPSVELRGVMVIKSKSKTRAKQRKGAVTNWKRVGKVTITALKRRKMTGEQMRQLMWGHRSSICTPQTITPRQQSIEVESIAPMRKDEISGGLDLSGLNDLNSSSRVSAGGTGSPNLFDCLDERISDPMNVRPDNYEDGSQQQGHQNYEAFPGMAAGSSQPKSKRRGRNITTGLRPKIVIFSEKKDLIRVSLDSDEDDSDLDFGSASTTAYKYNPAKYLRGNMKSARRKSIAGESINFSSSTEDLHGDTDIEEELSVVPERGPAPVPAPRVEVTSAAAAVGARGADNLGFEPDVHPSVSEPAVLVSGGSEMKGAVASSSKKGSRPKSASGKKGSSAHTHAHAHTSSTSKPPPLEEIAERVDEVEGEQIGKQKRERSKSAKKAAHTSEKTHTGEKASTSTSASRPQTAFSRTSEVTNMSKIVAWDRPEDYI